MFETLNDFIAINDILFSSIIIVYRLTIDNELSLHENLIRIEFRIEIVKFARFI